MEDDTVRNPIVVLVIFILACLAVGGIGSMFTTPAIPVWYASLNKPSWNPPSWVFGPVWTILYILMAVSAWLVWKERGATNVTVPLTLFAIQLFFNLIWSWIFFGLHLPGWAFLDIVLIWTFLLATIISFWTVSPLAGALLIPYIVWVSYASTLNFAIWRMNQ